MFSDWFGVAPYPLLLTILKTVGVYFVVIALHRLNGLRSFAKITGFDFAMTVAVGSALAATMMSKDPPMLRAALAIGTLFVLQKIVARLRRFGTAEQIFDNTPVLLVDNGEILWEALDEVDLTEEDLRAKLRQSSVLRLEDVRAVVLETTGDMSIIQSHGDEKTAFNDWLLDGVRRAERLDTYGQEGAQQPAGGE
jgi:uncharacterized membrane protein YcaP (DUF421 family)